MLFFHFLLFFSCNAFILIYFATENAKTIVICLYKASSMGVSERANVHNWLCKYAALPLARVYWLQPT